MFNMVNAYWYWWCTCTCTYDYLIWLIGKSISNQNMLCQMQLINDLCHSHMFFMYCAPGSLFNLGSASYDSESMQLERAVIIFFLIMIAPHEIKHFWISLTLNCLVFWWSVPMMGRCHNLTGISSYVHTQCHCSYAWVLTKRDWFWMLFITLLHAILIVACHNGSVLEWP